MPFSHAVILMWFLKCQARQRLGKTPVATFLKQLACYLLCIFGERSRDPEESQMSASRKWPMAQLVYGELHNLCRRQQPHMPLESQISPWKVFLWPLISVF